MRFRRTLLALSVTLAAASPLAARAAEPVEITGAPCALADVSDPLAETGARSGTLSGGPLAVTDNGSPVAGLLRCSVQVDRPGHAGSAEVSTSAHGITVVVVPPTLVSFRAGETTYVCSDFTPDGGATLYLDVATGAWTTDRTAGCPVAPVPDVEHPITGGVTITRGTTGAPVVTLSGVLGSSLLWNCSQSAFPAGPFTVTCTPVVLGWYCAVLHASAAAALPGAYVRATMDCGGSSGITQTQTVTGPGYDSMQSVPVASVTQFTCTADNGYGGPLDPGTSVFCGDPGAPRRG